MPESSGNLGTSDAGCGLLRNYSIYHWPFAGKRYFELTEEEGREAFEWFLSVKEHRLRELSRAVGSEDAELAPKLDRTPESLKHLNTWFSRHVHIRKAFPLEIERERKDLMRTPLAKMADRLIPEWGFVSETVTLEFDIGIYFGEVLIGSHPGSKWKRSTYKRFHKNQPIPDGFRLVAPLVEVHDVALLLLKPDRDIADQLTWRYTLCNERWKGHGYTI